MLIRNSCLVLGLLAATCSHIQIASAQTPANASDRAPQQIITVANRVPIPIRRVATSVSVIDEAMILDRGNISLKDILRQSTAIGGSNYGGSGSIAQVRIRGEEGFRTLMLFDGIKLSDTSAPQVGTPIEHLLSGGIGRVEVLRGPHGLNYGADAGGVVSISSRASEPGLAVHIDGQKGSFGSEQLTGNISAANDRVDVYLSASELNSEGYNARISDNLIADKDGYENQSYHARIGVNVLENLRLELVQHSVDGHTQYDGCYSGTTVYDCETIYNLDATRLSATFNTDTLSHVLAYTTTDTDRDDRALGVSAFGSQGELQRWEYTGSATRLPGFDLVFGVDLEQEHSGANQRDNEGYYLEALSDFSENLFFTAGVRQDHNDDFGSHQSYRFTTAYLFDVADGALKFKASYGTGFRAPSLYEVAYNTSSFAYPPASLTRLGEETSAGFEYGIEYTATSGLHLELVRFDQDVEDAIYFDLAAFSGYLQDTGTSSSKGYEAIVEFPLSGQLHLSANYTYNDTKRPNGLQRLRRPQHLANLGLSFRDSTDKLAVHVFYRATRDAIDEVFGSIEPLEATRVLDLGASYRLTANIEMYGRVENVLNDEFEEVIDYRSPERASYIGIRVNF